MIRRLTGVLIFAAIVFFTLWLSWPPNRPPQPVTYACSGGDTLTVLPLDTTRIRLSRPDHDSTTLRQRPSDVGATYSDSASGLVFWAKGPSAVLHRGLRPLQHGCTALDDENVPHAPDSLRRYAAALQPGTWWFALQHADLSQLRREQSSLIRLLYAGPQNEPPALTDGFSVAVGLETISQGTTLTEFAESSAHPPSPLLSPPQDTSLGTRPAVHWRQKSGLGDSIHRWALRLTDQKVATVATSTMGTDSSRYQTRIDDMLESLEFWQMPRPVPGDTTVPLAMLADPGDTPDRGCDDVVSVPHDVPRTLDVLTTALDTLFAIDRDSVGGARHFLNQTNETLSFERAHVKRDTARVYLNGRLSGLRGVCDTPRARIQIEETVRSIASVDTVKFFLDGTPTALQPNGRGARK